MILPNWLIDVLFGLNAFSIVLYLVIEIWKVFADE